jgi:hypothetical protein
MYTHIDTYNAHKMAVLLLLLASLMHMHLTIR